MASSRTGLVQAFSALGYRDYRRFALSLLLTSLGAQLLQVAILWQVYEVTGSALLLGLTGLARAVPHIALSLAGGVVADRVDRVRLIQSGQIANGLMVFALAALTITGTVEAWHLYIMTFLNSAFTALTQPARSALIPRLVPGTSLVNAIGLNSTIMQSSQITGPALGGIAIGVFGLGAVYLVNGALYVTAMLSLFGIATITAPPPTKDSPWRSFVEGMVFVRNKPVIVWLLVLDLGETVLGSYRALLPILAEMLGVGATGYGFLSAAPGAGSLVGVAFILSLGDMKYKGLFTIFGVLGYCVALVLLAVSPWFLLTLLAAALLGTTNSIQVIPRNSAILAIAPDALRGRVEAFRTMLAGGGPPLGYTLSGALAGVFGPATALVAGAVACAALVAAVGLARRELWDPHLGTLEKEAGEMEPAGASGRV